MERILSIKFFLHPTGPVLLTPNRTHTKIQQNHQRGRKPLAALQGSPGSGDEMGQALPFPRLSSRAKKDKTKRAALRIGNSTGNQGRGWGKRWPGVSLRGGPYPGAGRATHPPTPRATSFPPLGISLSSKGARGTSQCLHCWPPPFWGEGRGLMTLV